MHLSIVPLDNQYGRLVCTNIEHDGQYSLVDVSDGPLQQFHEMLQSNDDLYLKLLGIVKISPILTAAITKNEKRYQMIWHAKLN